MLRTIFLVLAIGLLLPGASRAASLCNYTFSDWGACQPNGTQQRTIISSSPAGCIDWFPTLAQTCTYVPACAYTYSAWGACQPNGTQTRTVTSSSPSSCIGTPVLSQTCTYVAPAVAPTVTFSPAATTALSGGQAFDFSFSIDWGAGMKVTGFSLAYQGYDITQALLDARAAGTVKVGTQGNAVTFTVPGVALPSGQHKITVSATNATGTTVADWTITVSAPKYALSDDQKALIARNGKPDYLTITLSTDPQSRLETWAYIKAKNMYTFLDGTRVSEDPITVNPALYSKPPALDPALFTQDTTLQDVAQIAGGSYVEIAPPAALKPLLGAIRTRTYYFAAKGLYVTFANDRLAVLKTLDIPKGN